MLASIGSRVGTLTEVLTEVLTDFTGPLGDKLRRGLPESGIFPQLGDSLREIRDTWGVTKEAMAGIVPEPWLEWGQDAERGLTPRPPEADMLGAHDAVNTNSRKAQYQLGKLVNQERHAAHTASLEELPETASSFGPGDPMGGTETKAFAKARYRSLQGAGATACLRTRPTDSLRVITRSRVRGHGKAVLGDRGTRGNEAPLLRICSRAGAQVNQHQTFVHAMSRTLNRLGIRQQVESGEPFTADWNLRMDIVVGRGGLRDAPNREHKENFHPAGRHPC